MNATRHPFPSAATTEAFPLPLTLTEGQRLHIPVTWITVQPGFNPRPFFEAAE
jgi:hypothetical protein